jgi:hypothetical protein
MPFHQHQKDSTLRIYITAAFQLLVFLTCPKKKYQVPLPDNVKTCLGILSNFLRSNKSQDEKLLAVHDVFMGPWKRKWPSTSDNQLPYPTIRALALMTMKLGGGFLEPKDVTLIIARFIYVLCLAYKIHRISNEDFNGFDKQACEQVQPWFTEKVDSPFNSLLSLQHRASSLTYKTMSLPRIWWTDCINWTSMLYKGNPLHIDQDRGMFMKLQDMVIKQWEEKVLCGLDVHVAYDFMILLAMMLGILFWWTHKTLFSSRTDFLGPFQSIQKFKHNSLKSKEKLVTTSGTGTLCTSGFMNMPTSKPFSLPMLKCLEDPLDALWSLLP